MHDVVPNKTGRIREKNQMAILKAAEEEFADHGFKGAGMGSIADRAGVPRPNVHYYFKNKTVLYREVLLSIVRSWIDLLGQPQPEDDPAEVLKAYIHAKVMYSKNYPVASRVFANELLRGAPMVMEYLNGEHREWFTQQTQVINSWITQGKMDPVDPATLIFLIWSSTQYYADFAVQVSSVRAKPPASKDFQRIADNLTRIILKGCGL